MYIKREIDLHCKLDHPNIVKCEDWFEDSTHVYLILEYAEKGDLFEHFKKGPMTDEFLFKIFYQTASAIQHMHR